MEVVAKEDIVAGEEVTISTLICRGEVNYEGRD
jgi:hypothetical protein